MPFLTITRPQFYSRSSRHIWQIWARRTHHIWSYKQRRRSSTYCYQSHSGEAVPILWRIPGTSSRQTNHRQWSNWKHDTRFDSHLPQRCNNSQLSVCSPSWLFIPLKEIGETRLTFVRDKHKLYFEGLVVKNLDSEVLAGIPFMENNEIAISYPPSRCQVLIGNDSVYQDKFSDFLQSQNNTCTRNTFGVKRVYTKVTSHDIP